MQVNRQIKLKSFKFKDNFNIDYTPYYTIEKGVYKFLELNTKLSFMYKYGIMCLCERKYSSNGKLDYYYYNTPITDEQKEFLKKRAIGLAEQYNVNKGEIIKYECGCKNKKR